MRSDVIQLRIIVEGVLLPPRAWGSFECTFQRRAPATGVLTVPAIPGINQEDWARARVNVFWSDIDIRNQSSDWPLLFDGEIAASAFAKSANNRQIVFRLVGPEIYWEQCKLYFYSFDRTPNEQTTGNSSQLITLNQRTYFFGNRQVKIDSGQPGIGLQNQVLNKMKEVGNGKPIPSMIRRVLKDSVGNVNFFFQQANEQLKLDRRFALPRDDNVSLLYGQTDLFFQQIEGNVAAKDGAVPIGDVLRDSLGLIRYQWLNNSQPKFITGDGQRTRMRVAAEHDASLADLDARVIGALGASTADLGVTARSTDEDLQAIASDHTVDLLTTANLHPESLNQDDLLVLSSVTATDDDIDKRNSARVQETFNFLLIVRDELARINAPATQADGQQLADADDDQPSDQIAQFLLLPETDFAPPPCCNVIFPNENLNIGLSFDYLTEPTRSMLTVPVVTDNIQTVYFAPESLADAVIPSKVVQYNDKAIAPYPPVLGIGTTVKITSHFGQRFDPTQRPDGNPRIEGHGAIDLAVPVGTPVFAFDAGTVKYAGPAALSGNGIWVVIDHANGLQTIYLHLSAVLVSPHQKVSAGQQIALSGNTGRSTGPHLHFEMQINNAQQDPEPHVLAAVAKLAAAESAGNTASSAVQQPQISTAEVSLADGAQNKASRFDDFAYLTPEEQTRGIVPVYDTSMDKVSVVFDRDNKSTLDAYLKQYQLANFQRQKYMARGADGFSLPWSPRIAVGFPSLVVDPVRSYIAQVESVTHRYSAQGGGEASSAVILSQPRFWNEGDPYYWRGGLAKFTPGANVATTPDADVARFPSFYLPSLVATNSYNTDPTTASIVGDEPFGGAVGSRPCDDLYQALLGVNAIPYFYGERVNPATGVTVGFNQAIDGVDVQTKQRSKSTIVGYYEQLNAQDKELAQNFVKNFTRRTGATESEFVTSFLGANAGQGAYTYEGGPFRRTLADIVVGFLEELQSADAFRG